VPSHASATSEDVTLDPQRCQLAAHCASEDKPFEIAHFTKRNSTNFVESILTRKQEGRKSSYFDRQAPRSEQKELPSERGGRPDRSRDEGKIGRHFVQNDGVIRGSAEAALNAR